MTDLSFNLLANYEITVKGFTYEGIASIREDFFDYGHLGTEANYDVLQGIIEDEGLPLTTDLILDWELSRANWYTTG